jgi:hypothetical protein
MLKMSEDGHRGTFGLCTGLCFHNSFINKGRLIVRMKSISHRGKSSLVNKCHCPDKGFLLYLTGLVTFSHLLTQLVLCGMHSEATELY